MKLLLLVLAAGTAFVVIRWVMALGPAGRRKLSRWTLGLAVAALLAGVSFRYGLHWLVVAGAALFAVLRRLLPFAVSWLPLIRGVRRTGSKHHCADSGAGGGWRPSGGFAGGGTANSESSAAGGGQRRGRPMSRQEALQVLGLEDGASRADVVQAYRDLMKRIHPDRGGPAYLAAKVNEAREVLLLSQND